MPTVKYNQPCPVSDITITFPSTSGTLALAGGGGITGFTSQISTAAPNATVNVSQLLVAVSTTNGDIALQPKGTGAMLAQIPDSTTTGGDKRGQYAVDFQRGRSTNSARVASGTYSVIVGGYNNRAANNYDIVVGGTGNQASGSGCFIGGGDSHVASGGSCTIPGGQGNQATANYAVVSGGQQNFAQGTHSVVSGGYQNYATTTYAFVGGGNLNYANALAATVGGGYQCYAQSQYSTVAGGATNQCYATNANYATISGGSNHRIGETSTSAASTISGGQSNTINGVGSTIVGGTNNILTGSYSTILGGNLNYIVNGVQYATAVGTGASARDFGANSFANYYYSSVGDAQATDIVLSARTFNATPATLGMSGSNVGVIIPANTSATFSIFVTCRQTASSNVGGWEITGVIENTAGTLTAYNVTSNLIHRSVGTWSATAVANSGTGRLDVQVTGSAATVQWVATARITFSTIA